MIQTVLKRDGRVVGFNEEKIATAIRKAMLHTDKGEDLQLIHQITDRISFKGDSQMTVEAIQDLVEVELMKSSRKDVAQKYIAYRNQRSIARKAKTRDMFLEIINIKSNDITRENANMNADTPAGMMMKFASETTKPFVDDYLLSEEVLDAVTQNYLHIHDKDYYPTKSLTCVQHPLDHILKYGFSAGHGESRPAKRIETASILGCISLETAQNEMHGGQAIPAFDFYLAPYVRNSFIEEVKNLEELNGKDYSHLYQKELADYLLQPLDGLTGEDRIVQHAVNKTVSRVHQSMEAFIHNMNTIHSRGGNQVVFSSINYGTDISPEGRMVMRNVLLATDAGLGHGETPIFPIQIFRVKEGVNYNPGDPNYDLFQLSCKVSAKRLFPNFSFIDSPFNLQYYKPGHPETEVSYMGCRTRVMGNVYDPSQEIANGRGNLSFTSINLPRLAIESHGDEALFYEKLKDMMELVIGQLDDRFAIQSKKRVYNFPFLMGQGVWLDSEKLGPSDEVGEVLKHGTLSIGFIGLAETLISLYGHHHGESDAMQEKGLAIVQYMRQYLDARSERTHMNYSLLATPAEGLSGRFVRMDKKRYGLIPGVTDKDYYTNSFHIPVYYNISAYEKIRKEAPYHALTNAGHISYVELDGDTANNLEAFESIVRCMHDCGIGYGSINHPVDRDPICGYVGVIGEVCPRCGRREGEAVSPERIKELRKLYPGTFTYCGCE